MFTGTCLVHLKYGINFKSPLLLLIIADSCSIHAIPRQTWEINHIAPVSCIVNNTRICIIYFAVVTEHVKMRQSRSKQTGEMGET